MLDFDDDLPDFNGDKIGRNLVDHIKGKRNDELVDINIFHAKNPINVLKRAITTFAMLRPQITAALRTLIDAIKLEQGPLKAALKGITNAEPDPVELNNVIGISAVPIGALPEIINRSDVKYIDLDKQISIDDFVAPPFVLPPDIANPPLTTPLWNLERIHVPELWDKGLTGKDVKVAIVDTGINFKHPDLAKQMWDGGKFPAFAKGHGFNFGDFNHDTSDNSNGHGTKSAGIIAGNGTGNGKQAIKTGIAPGVTIMSLRITKSTPKPDVFTTSERIYWKALSFAVLQECDVISVSHAWKNIWRPAYWSWRVLSTIIHWAGIIHVNSAGNEYGLEGCEVPFNVGAPANCPPPWLHELQKRKPLGQLASAIAVGGSLPDKKNSIYSSGSTGPSKWLDYPYFSGLWHGLIKPDICAPAGCLITCSEDLDTYYTTDPTEMYGATSGATPHVAGVAALLIEAQRKKTPGERLRPGHFLEAISYKPTIMKDQKKAKEDRYGCGLINAYEAYQYGNDKWW
ncbi:MAG: S8 family peptidase [Gemmatales bacterium]